MSAGLNPLRPLVIAGDEAKAAVGWYADVFRPCPWLL
jgi:hypothetical protein